jgi:hypothetical protein
MYVFSLKPFSGFITVYALYSTLPETPKFLAATLLQHAVDSK